MKCCIFYFNGDARRQLQRRGLECRQEGAVPARPPPHHVRKLKNECMIRQRARRRVVAPAGGSAMPSLLGFGLGTRACGPHSLLLGTESRSGVSAAVHVHQHEQWSAAHSTADTAVVDRSCGQQGAGRPWLERREDRRRRRNKQRKS